MARKLHLTWLTRLALLLNLTGALTGLLGLSMLPSLLIAWWDGAPDLAGHTWATSGALLGGLVLWLGTRQGAKGIEIGHREGFLIVGFGWFAAGLIGALPYYLYAHLAPGDICGVAAGAPVGVEFCSFTNAAFESISGFTTTGSSIISNGLWGTADGLTPDGVVGLPRGILLWRSMTHFLGGMGIIVLSVAILPLLGVSGMQLFKAEVPGPTTDKLAPRVGETAKLLWKVYLIFSVVCAALLMAGGMSLFEATCHSMATMATGGFSTRAASVAGFESSYVEWVIVAFMFVAGANFTLHFTAFRKGLKTFIEDLEWRVYTGICVIATGVVATALFLQGPGFSGLDSLRIAAFQVLSIVTTTGFASHDFETWTYAPVALLTLVTLMFVGGMAGSTGGGVKVVRHILIVKMWVRELFLLSHPKAIRPVRMAGAAVPPDVIRATASFISVYIALLCLGTALFTLDGHDMTTAFTCAASSLGNIGPGLGEIGPYDNYAVLGGAAKWLSAALMVLGRLEIYTLLVMLHPAFWRR